MIYIHSQETKIVFNRFIELIFIGSEQVRLRERETMLHPFRREDENLKFDIIFQAKLFTLQARSKGRGRGGLSYPQNFWKLINNVPKKDN